MAFPPARSTSSTILITAVYYDPYVTNEWDEAFRLTNFGDSPVDLNGWGITDEEGTVALDRTGTLDPGQSFWITRRAVEFKEEFGFVADYQFGGVDIDVPYLGMAGNFALANSGDELILRDPSDIVDSVVYGDGDPTGIGWSGPTVKPYGGTGVGAERFDLLGPDEEEGFGIEGQILYRKLDQATGLPVPDTDTASDWAQDPNDDINGKKVQYPGWDLERYFFTETFTETTSLIYAIAPDHIYAAVVSEIERATTSI
jgi:hypothetical protein